MSTVVISNTALNISIPSSLTNEIPHLSIYNILNKQLRNDWSREFIGVASADYTKEYESIKMMNGVQSSLYTPKNITFSNPDDNEIYNADFEKINFSVDGAFETEIDYLMHEMSRYLSKLYPDDFNTIVTLTEAERQSYFNEALHMVHSYFDTEQLISDTSSNYKLIYDLYFRNKFLTGITPVRSLTGTTEQESALVNLLNVGDFTCYSGYKIFVNNEGQNVISNQDNEIYDLSKVNLSTYFYNNSSTVHQKIITKLHGKIRENNLSDFISASYKELTIENSLEYLNKFFLLRSTDPLDLIEDLYSGTNINSLDFNFNQYFYQATVNNWITNGVGIDALKATQFGLKDFNWRKDLPLYFLYSHNTSNAYLFPIGENASPVNILSLENRLVCQGGQLKNISNTLLLCFDQTYYNPDFLLASGNIIYSALTQLYAGEVKEQNVSPVTFIDGISTSVDTLQYLTNIYQKDSKGNYKLIISGFLNKNTIDTIDFDVSQYLTSFNTFEDSYNLSNMFSYICYKDNLMEQKQDFNIQKDLKITFSTILLFDTQYWQNTLVVEDTDNSLLNIRTDGKDTSGNPKTFINGIETNDIYIAAYFLDEDRSNLKITLNYKDSNTGNFIAYQGTTKTGKLLGITNNSKYMNISYNKDSGILKIDNSEYSFVNQPFYEKDTYVYKNEKVVGRWAVLTDEKVTKKENFYYFDYYYVVNILSKIQNMDWKSSEISSTYRQDTSTVFDLNASLSYETTLKNSYLTEDKDSSCNIYYISINWFKSLQELIEDYTIINITVKQRDTNTDNSNNNFIYYSQLLLSGKTFTAPSTIINNSSISSYLSIADTISLYELQTYPCYFYADNIIRIEKDIKTIIDTWGRVNSIILTNTSQVYPCKIIESEIKNEYCYLKLDSDITGISNLDNPTGYIIIDINQQLLSEDTGIEKNQRTLDSKQIYQFKDQYYIYKYNYESLAKTNLNFVLDNIYSDNPKVYKDDSIISQNTKIPEVLSEMQYLTILDFESNSDKLKIIKDLIEENKSLYLNTSLKLLNYIPLNKHSLVYNPQYESYSYLYNEDVPSYISFYNFNNYNYFEDFNDLINAVDLDEITLADLIKLYNRRYIIWGDVVWDANYQEIGSEGESEKTYQSVPAFRTIWSGYFTNFKIWTTDDIIPDEEDLFSYLNAVNMNTYNQNILNYNYAYNSGAPNINWKIALTFPISKENIISVKAINNYSHKIVENEFKKQQLNFTENTFPIEGFIITTNKVEDINKEYNNNELALTKIAVDIDFLDFKNLTINYIPLPEDSLTINYSKDTKKYSILMNQTIGNFQKDNSYSWNLAYNMIHLDGENIEPAGIVERYCNNNDILELFIENCVYEYYNHNKINGKTALDSDGKEYDILENFISENISDDLVSYWKEYLKYTLFVNPGEEKEEWKNDKDKTVALKDVLNESLEFNKTNTGNAICIPCIAVLDSMGTVKIYSFFIEKVNSNTFNIYEDIHQEKSSGDLVDSLFFTPYKTFQTLPSLYGKYLKYLYTYTQYIPPKATGIIEGLGINLKINYNQSASNIIFEPDTTLITNKTELSDKNTFLNSNFTNLISKNNLINQMENYLTKLNKKSLTINGEELTINDMDYSFLDASNKFKEYYSSIVHLSSEDIEDDNADAEIQKCNIKFDTDLGLGSTGYLYLYDIKASNYRTSYASNRETKVVDRSYTLKDLNIVGYKKNGSTMQLILQDDKSGYSKNVENTIGKIIPNSTKNKYSINNYNIYIDWDNTKAQFTNKSTGDITTFDLIYDNTLNVVYFENSVGKTVYTAGLNNYGYIDTTNFREGGLSGTIIPISESLGIQKIETGNLNLGQYWKDPGLDIGYTFYKRKFIAEGIIDSSDTTIINLTDESLINDENFTLKDHIAVGDSIQIYMNNPSSFFQEGNTVTLQKLTDDNYVGPYKVIYSKTTTSSKEITNLEPTSIQQVILSGPGNLVYVEINLSNGSVNIGKPIVFDSTYTYIAYALSDGTIIYYDRKTACTKSVTTTDNIISKIVTSTSRITPQIATIAASASVASGSTSLNITSVNTEDEDDVPMNVYEDWYIFDYGVSGSSTTGEEITSTNNIITSASDLTEDDLEGESEVIIFNTSDPVQVLTNIPLNDGYLNFDNYDRIYFEPPEDTDEESTWKARPDNAEYFDASEHPNAFISSTSDTTPIDINSASTEQLRSFIRNTIVDMYSGYEANSDSVSSLSNTILARLNESEDWVADSDTEESITVPDSTGKFVIDATANSRTDSIMSSVAKIIFNKDSGSIDLKKDPIYIPKFTKMDIPIYSGTANPKYKKVNVVSGTGDISIDSAEAEDLLPFAKALLDTHYFTREVPQVTSYIKNSKNIIAWDQDTSTVTIMDKTGNVKKRIGIPSLGFSSPVSYQCTTKNQPIRAYSLGNRLYVNTNATGLKNYYDRTNAYDTITAGGKTYGLYATFGVKYDGSVENRSAPLFLPTVFSAYNKGSIEAIQNLAAVKKLSNAYEIAKMLYVVSNESRFLKWMKHCIRLDYLNADACEFPSFKDTIYDVNMGLLSTAIDSLIGSSSTAAVAMDGLQEILSNTMVANIVKGLPYYTTDLSNAPTYDDAFLTSVNTTGESTYGFESLIKTSGISVSGSYLHIYGTINWPALNGQNGVLTSIKNQLNTRLKASALTDETTVEAQSAAKNAVINSIVDEVQSELETNFAKFIGDEDYPADKGAERPFKVTVDLNTYYIDSVMVSTKLGTDNTNSELLSITNTGDTLTVLTPEGSFGLGDETSTILSVDSTETENVNKVKISKGIILVYEALKTLDSFSDDISVDSSGNITVKLSGTVVANADIFYSTVSQVFDKYIKIQHDTIILDDGAQATATILVKSYTGDNFKYGYGTVPNLEYYPSAETLFEVPSAYYADFATYENKASYNVYDEDTDSYYKESVFNLYPTWEVIDSSLRENFYKTENDKISYLKNGRNRYILRICDVANSIGGRFVYAKNSLQKTNTVANEFINNRYLYKSVTENSSNINKILMSDKRSWYKSYSTLINSYNIQKIPALVDNPWEAIQTLPYKLSSFAIVNDSNNLLNISKNNNYIYANVKVSNISNLETLLKSTNSNFSGENLLNGNSVSCTNYSGGSISSGNFSNGIYTLNNVNTTENYIYFPYITLTEGKTYTISGEVMGNTNLSSAEVYIYNNNYATTGFISAKYITTNTSTYTPFTLTFTVKAKNTETCSYDSFRVRFDNNGTKTKGQNASLYIRNIKLEENSFATTFTYSTIENSNINVSKKYTTNISQLSTIDSSYSAVYMPLSLSTLGIKIINKTETLPVMKGITNYSSRTGDDGNLIIRTTNSELYIPNKGYGQSLLGEYTTPENCLFDDKIFYDSSLKTVNTNGTQFTLVDENGDPYNNQTIYIPKLMYKSFAQADVALDKKLATKNTLNLNDALIDLSQFDVESTQKISFDKIKQLNLLDFVTIENGDMDAKNDTTYSYFLADLEFSCKAVLSTKEVDLTTNNVLNLSTNVSANYTVEELIDYLGYTRVYKNLVIPANYRYLNNENKYVIYSSEVLKDSTRYSVNKNGELIYLDRDGQITTTSGINPPIPAPKSSKVIEFFTIHKNKINSIIEGCFYFSTKAFIKGIKDNTVKPEDTEYFKSILVIKDPNTCLSKFTNIRNTSTNYKWDNTTTFNWIWPEDITVDLNYSVDIKKYNFIYLKNLKGEVVGKIFVKNKVTKDNLLVFSNES